MIIGIGTDIEELSRIRRSCQNPRFLREYFGEKERELLMERGLTVESIAGNFCAKEAFSKALGTGVRAFRLSEIQVLRHGNGAPYFHLEGGAKRAAEKKEVVRAHVSISHSRSDAVAYVILEG